MPIYQYKCKKCGHDFELLLPMGTNHEEINCTSCGLKETKRIYAPFGFKGSSSGGGGTSCSSGCSGCSGC